ncbi:MAG: hypothetical protein D6814_00900 [Calditrichaeota bacterium]|nr:MAG: hypothetical protein D6814_00900 [Calditrichota bacterium]
MRCTHLGRVVVALIAALALSSCQKYSSAEQTEHPAKLEPVEGSHLIKVILTERAMERINLKTDVVREVPVRSNAEKRKVVPYGALIYDPQGETWIYISPEPRTFMRHRVAVDYIEGNRVVLKEGPPAGTVVASVGVAELYGTEFKVGH